MMIKKALTAVAKSTSIMSTLPHIIKGHVDGAGNEKNGLAAVPEHVEFQCCASWQ